MRWFRGAGLEHAFICLVCADALDGGDVPEVSDLCPECFDRATDGDLVGVRVPAVVERPDGTVPQVSHHSLPVTSAPIIELAHAERANRWFALCADGSILRVEPGWRDAVVVATSAIVAEPDHETFMGHALTPRLVVASSGAFVAVANDYGRWGMAIDLSSGEVTMRLDGGDYQPRTVPFSMVFAVDGDRDVLVHRTDWNRLDVSDPATGTLLTERGPTSYSKGEAEPDHYLDYFHGRIHLSPECGRVVDDGWVWHPVGIPETWSLSNWLSENVWESEDGPSKRSLDSRDYYWDHGMCWIDEQRVAIEGIGTDDDHMVAGARVFDVTQADPSSTPRWTKALEIAQFAGPSGDFFSDGTRLFSVDRDGLSVWSLDDGARVARLDGFSPRFHSRGMGELVELRRAEAVVWSYRGRG